MDVEDIAPGQNFTETIDSTLSQCEAVLAVIGPHWFEILKRRQADKEADYVRHELEAALKRKIKVIPLLVGGADLKQLSDLPDDLRELSFHQAVELRDSTFRDDLSRIAKALGAGSPSPFHTRRLRVAGAVTAILILVSVWLSIGPLAERRKQTSQARQLLDTAETRMALREYQSAFKTFGDANDADPKARERRVDAAMAWIEDFHVVTSEGEKSQDKAAPLIAEILPVLEAGFARTTGQGQRAADIMAHIGWAHWLNQKMAFKEFGDAAEQGLKRSLAIEPSNVYGNAMLGNWLLQTDGNVDEAIRHFDTAIKTNKERALVRRMQLGGMIYNDKPVIRRELIRIANQMRLDNEPLPKDQKHRILASYSPTLHDWDELVVTLTAVPPGEAWPTYLWLEDDTDSGSSDEEWQRIQPDFIHAGILELGGKKAEALIMFKDVQERLAARHYSGRITGMAAAAVKRLSG
jgi:tetratricopeptide (TPR) repeat protein